MFTLDIDDETNLRLLGPGDAREYFDLVMANAEHIRQWMFWLNDDYSIDTVRRHIEESIERHAARRGFEVGIFFRGDLAGAIYYSYFEWPHRTTEIGYWLGASFQGNGLATKACRALIAYAFDDLKLNRVQIRCMESNARSRAVAHRLGFIQEGVIREARWLNDRFENHVVYGLLAREFNNEDRDG